MKVSPLLTYQVRDNSGTIQETATGNSYYLWWLFYFKKYFYLGINWDILERLIHLLTLDLKRYLEKNEVFHDKLTFIYLELPKFNLREEDLKTNVEKWLYFLKHLEDFNELPNILNQPIFRKAFERPKKQTLQNALRGQPLA